MTVPDRKLTTVFSADVQGFSRLMEVDEEGTYATLKTYRDAMARLIQANGGRVVNTWGDGVIAEFASVVGAVRAAIDVQNELAHHNAGRPDRRRMDFRIGINLGDVIIDGDDIYGDGVNIAARLQAAAEPGGILISSTVHDQVRNKLSVGFDYLGSLSVKNIDEAVPSYSVRIGESPAPRRASAAGTARPRRDAGVGLAALGAPADVVIAGTRVNRKLAAMAMVAAGLVAINLLGSPGEFWARWPLLGMAAIAGLGWARRTTRFDRLLAIASVLGLSIVAVNLFSWEGLFWAIWPLLFLAFLVAMRWLARRR